MNGLIRTLPVSPPPVVGRGALNSGSGVWPLARSLGSPSALSVMLLTGPDGSTGVPSWLTSWNDPIVAEPVFVVRNCGPVSVTAPTKELAGTLVPVTARPVSSATIELSVMVLEEAPPVTVSVGAAGGLPAPPSTMPGTQSAGTSRPQDERFRPAAGCAPWCSPWCSPGSGTPPGDRGPARPVAARWSGRFAAPSSTGCGTG